MKFNEQILKVEQSKIRQFNNFAREYGCKTLLTLGEPDFYTPDVIKDECIKALNEHKTKYSHTLGSLELREAISKFEKKKNNIDYSVDEIVVTMGSTEALTASLMTILNPGDEVIVPIPCYALYRPIIEYLNAKMVSIDTSLNNFQINKSMLESKLTNKTKAIILTTPNNPTGCIYSNDTLEEIYNLVKGKDIFVICDACYSQLVYTPSFSGFYKYQDIKDQIIVCQSFSKPYAMPGWRIGYVLGSKEFIHHVSKIHQYVAVAPNTFIQPAAIKALEFDPSCFIESYKKRRDYVYERLINMGLEVVKPEGAFYMFPSIKKFNIDSWTFCTNLVKKYSVALIPGICFETDDFIRISYCVSEETLKTALDALQNYINELEKGE